MGENDVVTASDDPTIAVVTTDNSLSSGTATGLSVNGQRSASRPDGSGRQEATAEIGVDSRAGALELRASGRPSRHSPLRAAVVRVLAALLGALVVGGAAFGYNATKQRTYTSESLVIVLTDGGSGDVSPITAAWVNIGEAPLVIAGAAREVDVDASRLRAALTVSQPASTPLVSIKMTTTDPRRSAIWANAMADQLLAQGAARPIPGFSLNQLTVAVPAQQADAGMGTALILGVAFVGALVGGVLGRRVLRWSPEFPVRPWAAVAALWRRRRPRERSGTTTAPAAPTTRAMPKGAQEF